MYLNHLRNEYFRMKNYISRAIGNRRKPVIVNKFK